MIPYKCKSCGRVKLLNKKEIFFSLNWFGKYILIRCPDCGKLVWFKKLNLEG